MTRQAIVGDLVLLMALHAPLHGDRHERLGERFGQVHHVSMACFAANTTQRHVPPVGEIDVIGDPVNPLPRNLLLLIGVGQQLNFSLCLSQGFGVTINAYLNGGECCSCPLRHIGVAVGAIHVLLLYMEIVAEQYGLKNVRGFSIRSETE